MDKLTFKKMDPSIDEYFEQVNPKGTFAYPRGGRHL